MCMLSRCSRWTSRETVTAAVLFSNKYVGGTSKNDWIRIDDHSKMHARSVHCKVESSLALISPVSFLSLGTKMSYQTKGRKESTRDIHLFTYGCLWETSVPRHGERDGNPSRPADLMDSGSRPDCLHWSSSSTNALVYATSTSLSDMHLVRLALSSSISASRLANWSFSSTISLMYSDPAVAVTPGSSPSVSPLLLASSCCMHETTVGIDDFSGFKLNLTEAVIRYREVSILLAYFKEWYCSLNRRVWWHLLRTVHSTIIVDREESSSKKEGRRQRQDSEATRAQEKMYISKLQRS